MSTISKKSRKGVFTKGLDKLAGEMIMTPEQAALDNQLMKDYLVETIVHNLMLVKQNIISKEDGKLIVTALMEIQKVHQEGRFDVLPEIGDVHENVEKKLIKMIGEAGKRFHTSRSRNDQIETDTRMYLRRCVLAALQDIIQVEEALLRLGRQNAEVVMPGYTHMQHAQPMTFGFWVLSYLAALLRDWKRLKQTFEQLNKNSLGVGASFGLTYPIDREYVTRLLGFDGTERNGLDVISNRGENVAGVLSALSFIFLHLGRMAGELILFTTYEYDYVKVGEEFSTGSSIMPQKRNQDILELIRSQNVSINAMFYKVMELQRNMPSGYNRDQRDTKTALGMFSSVQNTLRVMAKLLATIKPNEEKMRNALSANFSTATDMADALVSEYDIAFHDAHTIVGKLVRSGLEKGKRLGQLSLETIRKTIKTVSGMEIEITDVFLKLATDPLASVRRRDHIGGTAPRQVVKMSKEYEVEIKNQIMWVAKTKEKLHQTELLLKKEVKKLCNIS